MNPEPPILEYAPSERTALSPWMLFVGGFIAGEALSVLLMCIMQADGPIFPFTVFYAPLAVIVEATPFAWNLLEVSLFILGPLLYGVYAMLLASRKRWWFLSIALMFHLVCFAITLHQRAVYRFW